MPTVAERLDAVSPSVTAAMLLAAVPLLEAQRLAHPSVAEVLTATGVSRSRAYELRARLQGLLGNLVQATGRPTKTQPAAPSGEVVAAVDVPASLLAYVRLSTFNHPWGASKARTAKQGPGLTEVGDGRTAQAA